MENEQTDLLSNWRTQIKKGYLELCILQHIQHKKRIYGFELIENMRANNLVVKEGTVYPIVNRMTEDKILVASWETENTKGHPRKFYSLTSYGKDILLQMQKEFEQMYETYSLFQNGETK